MYPRFPGVRLLDDQPAGNPSRTLCRGVTRRSSAGRSWIWPRPGSRWLRLRMNGDRGAGVSAPVRSSGLKQRAGLAQWPALVGVLPGQGAVWQAMDGWRGNRDARSVGRSGRLLSAGVDRL